MAALNIPLLGDLVREHLKAEGVLSDDDLAEFVAMAKIEGEAYRTPTPYEIAMTFGAAAVAAGKSENIAAAMAQAWAAVPEFYKARDWYVNEFAPMRMGFVAGGADGDETGG